MVRAGCEEASQRILNLWVLRYPCACSIILCMNHEALPVNNSFILSLVDNHGGAAISLV
jgi:hypothetical protein